MSLYFISFAENKNGQDDKSSINSGLLLHITFKIALLIDARTVTKPAIQCIISDI